MRNLTFFPKMWGIWLFSQKCEEFDFFPKMSANRRFLEKSAKTVSWICAERVSDFPRQTARGLMHQSDAFECKPMRVWQPTAERQRACVDLVYLAMVSQSFVYVQNSLFMFDSIRLTKPLSPRLSVQTLLSNLPHIPCLKRNTIQVK